MKKILLIIFLWCINSELPAQSLTGVKNKLYYQRIQSAKADLHKLIAMGPHDPELWYRLGEVYLAENKPDSARQILMNGISYCQSHNLSKKQYPLVYLSWAHMLINTGAVTEGRTQLEEILGLSKYKDPEALLAAAKANINSKNADVAWAITLLEKAAKKDKKNPEIYSVMGDAYRKLINGSKAVISYNKAIDINPGYAEAFYKKGLIYKSQNNPEIYLEKFSEAVKADSLYAPALLELYQYYAYRNISKAGGYLKAYIENSDPSIDRTYTETDYLYLAGKYRGASSLAKNIIQSEGNKAQPRLYKLIAYCQASLGDSVSAEREMAYYFLRQDPKSQVSKDFELMAKLKEATDTDKSKSLYWYKKALETGNDEKTNLKYMVSLAQIQKDLGNREEEAIWRESIYTTKDRPNNIDLYNWGVALYMSENYTRADSVFGIYSEKYPDQVYGYLWQARCNAILDSSMEKGAAIPYYIKLIDVAKKNTGKNKAMILKALGYLGTYEANIKKDFPASLIYFEKMLEVDPANNDALKYTELLKKWIEPKEEISL